MSIYTDAGYENKTDCYTTIAKNYNVKVSLVWNIASRYEGEADICELVDAIERRIGVRRMEDENPPW